MTFYLNEMKEAPLVQAHKLPLDKVPTFTEGLGAAWTVAADKNDANFRAYREIANVEIDISDQILDQVGVDEFMSVYEEQFPQNNPNWDPVETPDDVRALTHYRMIALQIAEQKKSEDPNAFSDIEMSEEHIQARVNENLQAEYKEAQDVLSMLPTGQRAAADFLGEAIGTTLDVKNIPFLLMGGGGGAFLRVVGREALINMGVEAAFLGSQYDMAERLNIPDPKPLQQLGMAAAAGGALGGLSAALGRGLDYYRGRNKAPDYGNLNDMPNVSAKISKVEDILSSGTGRVFEMVRRVTGQKAKELPDVARVPAQRIDVETGVVSESIPDVLPETAGLDIPADTAVRDLPLEPTPKIDDVQIDRQSYAGPKKEVEAQIAADVEDWIARSEYNDIITPKQRRAAVRDLQAKGGDVRTVVERKIPKAKRAEVQQKLETNQPRQPDIAPDAPQAAAAQAAEGADGIAPARVTQSVPVESPAAPSGSQVVPATQRKAFSDPTSPEAKVFQDGIKADIQDDIAAKGDFKIDMGDGKGERLVSEVLEELDQAQEFADVIALCGVPR